jgi:predicted outer membrane repeat protein
MGTKHILGILVLLALALPAAPAHASGVVTVCDEAHLRAALAGGGTVTFACSGTITLTAEIVIAADTTIDGSEQDVTISGNHAVRVFYVNSGVALTLHGLTVANGAVSNYEHGGGIYSAGMLTVSNSTFSGNSAHDFGGGVMMHGGTVSNCIFSDNSAAYGGGIYSGGATLTVSDCTFSGNSAAYGGGILNENYNDAVMIKNTTIANSPTGSNCSGAIITDGGGNLSYPDTTCPGINADPILGPLQDNGGPTWTMALGPGSAATDAGIDATCAADPVNGLDQRGITRPQGPHCDIGAYEHQVFGLWFPFARVQ